MTHVVVYRIAQIRVICNGCAKYARFKERPTKREIDSLHTGARRHGRRTGHVVEVHVVKEYGRP